MIKTYKWIDKTNLLLLFIVLFIIAWTELNVLVPMSVVWIGVGRIEYDENLEKKVEK